MTEGQQKAYDQNWQKYGLDVTEHCIDLSQIFGRVAPLVVEVGFGMGASLVQMAEESPDKDFIGIEVHPPGVAKIMMLAEEKGLSNLKVFCHDAIEVLGNSIPEGAVETFQLFFPDPWHKKKHNKRRIVQSEFVQLVRRVLTDTGVFHMATDWEPYAEHMLEVLEAEDGFKNVAGEGKYHPRPDWRPLTKFEKRGEKLGHGVWDLLYRKCRLNQE